MIIDIIAVSLALIHFAFPLAYYFYVKEKWLPRGWGLKISGAFEPRVTIIIPTYNEETYIVKKLENLYRQEYPRDKIHVVVVDSASTDRTVEKVKEWMSTNRDMKVTLLVEHTRRGMNPALNYALSQISDTSTEIVVFTDADSFWQPDSLKKVVKYFSDPSVGAVTTNVTYMGGGKVSVENDYRNFFNIIRVGESKYYGTPIHNGTLVAYRFDLIKKIGGIPEFTGNNDSTLASLISFMGFRSIQIDDTTVVEPLRDGQFYRKVRRAQHLILSFLIAKRFAKKKGLYVPTPFDLIWNIEWWLHVINPWIFVSSVILFLISALMYGSAVGLIVTLCGIALLLFRPYRTWIMHQLYLVLGTLKSLWTKSIVWDK